MNIFNTHYDKYDRWFEKYPNIYEEEIITIKSLMPAFTTAMEIGVGSGRFASALNIPFGIEPSYNMAKIAKKRGIKIARTKVEEINYKYKFDFVLAVTTICFVANPSLMIQNAYKSLKKGGFLTIAFIDKNSKLGRTYRKNKYKSLFYSNAKFFNEKEITYLMKKAGFTDLKCKENLYAKELNNMTFGINECKNGAFKVIRGKKPLF